MSPKTVLGGGTVGAGTPAADVEPDTTLDLAAVLAALTANGLAASEPAAIAAMTNLNAQRVVEILADAAAADRAWMLARPLAYLDASAAIALLERLFAALKRRENETPWLLGATSLALAREFDIAEALLVRILATAADRQLLTARNGYYATLGYDAHLTAEQSAFFDASIAIDPAQPLVPVAFEAFVQELRRSKIAGISGAFDTLAASGKLVRVGDHLYRGEQIAEIRARLVRTLRAEKRMTAARFRDVVGTSRKYVVPLLEFFDATGVTLRDGDQRVLRAV
jgi:selenocysteine-specific elongation factor